ncbi:hypothetical protein CMU94_01900 [Elizabethkingia anophelis]|nr:hypothetical protein [Elizabethkingia anophelis]
MHIESITKNFDPCVACNVGTDAAIILANIEIWQHHAKINGLNLYNGKNWIYNKVESFQKQFYYLTEKQISLCLKKLEDNGYLSVGCYNENVFDRTKWYTSERLNKSVFEPETKLPKSSIKQYDIDTIESFEQFWDLYDKKAGSKEKILGKWAKLNKSERFDIIKYIPKYKISQPNKLYRKNPETFLNNQSWKDEIICKDSNLTEDNTFKPPKEVDI